MSRFLAIVNASDPDLLASIEGANAHVVIAHDGGVLVIDGDADAAQAVTQLAAIRAVGPVDASWDTSSLGLDDAAQAFVDAWNGGYDEDYLAAAEQGYRRGEAWNVLDGCFQTGVEAEDGLVASALPETYGPQHFGWVDANADGVLDVTP